MMKILFAESTAWFDFTDYHYVMLFCVCVLYVFQFLCICFEYGINKRPLKKKDFWLVSTWEFLKLHSALLLSNYYFIMWIKVYIFEIKPSQRIHFYTIFHWKCKVFLCFFKRMARNFGQLHLFVEFFYFLV